MTAELRICVPDDVAEWIRRWGDESTAVTEAVRARIRADRVDELLRAAGLDLAGAAAPPRPEPPTLLAEGRRTLVGRRGP
jgi:hypothetical protein